MDTSQLEGMFNDTHGLWTSLSSFSEDQIKAVSKLLAASPGEKSVSSYYMGFLDGVNLTKHHICPTCQIKHADDDPTAFYEIILKKAGMGVEELKPLADQAKQMQIQDTHVSGQYL